MKLYHLSEEASISEFHPRPAKKQWGSKTYVWAISDEMKFNYYFPRACPRICIRPGRQSTEQERAWLTDRLEGHDQLIYCLTSWSKRVEQVRLFRYEFDPVNFRVIDSGAGYYVSENVEVPIARAIIEDPLQALSAGLVRVVFKEDLRAEYKLVATSNYRFSIIKGRDL